MIYHHAVIYRWINDVNNAVYLGSTIAIKGRRALHKHLSKTSNAPLYAAMRAIGFSHFTFQVIKAFPCASRRDLEREEYRMLDELIKAGTPVHNQKLSANEKKSAKTRQAMSLAKLGKATKNGCLRLSQSPHGNTNWIFTWRDQGKNVTRSFSCRKFGHFAAKKKAWDLRQSIYPKWQPDAEDEVCTWLCQLELD